MLKQKNWKRKSPKINQKKYKSDYVFVDEDIKALFNTSVLSLEGAKLKDISSFRYFTKVSFIVFDDCKIDTSHGIEYFDNKFRVIDFLR